MAYAYNTAGTGTFTSPATSGNFSANVGSGTDRMLWVAVLHDSYVSADLVTGVTYNGVALTKAVGRRLGTSDQYIGLWYLLNPTSGANSLAVTLSSSCYCYGAWEVVTGAPAGSTTVGSTTASADVASGTLSLNINPTQGAPAWLISAVRSTDTGSHTAGAGTTKRAEYAAAIGDGQSEKTPAGSFSNAWSANPSGKIGGIMAHFYSSSTNITVNPTAQVGTLSVPAPTYKHGSTLSPSAQVGTFSTPAPTVSLPKLVSVTPQVATFSIPAYSVILASIIVSPNVQSLTFSIPTYAVSTYALVMPNGQTLTFTLPANTVTVESNITISPNTLVLTFTTPTRAKVGAVWVKRGRSTNATWVRSTRNSN